MRYVVCVLAKRLINHLSCLQISSIDETEQNSQPKVAVYLVTEEGGLASAFIHHKSHQHQSCAFSLGNSVFPR